MNETYLVNRNLFNKTLICLIKSRDGSTLEQYCCFKTKKNQSKHTDICALVLTISYLLDNKIYFEGS